jgi:hypothetical protein
MAAASPSSNARVRSAVDVEATLSYLAPGEGPVEVRAYPPNSGRETSRPASRAQRVSIRDARAFSEQLRLDEQGFELHAHRSSFVDYYDPKLVESYYYDEVSHLMRALTGALTVLVFDHNVRSAVRAARGEVGVRTPVDQVHNDYTVASGPRRKQEVLEAAGRLDLMGYHVAFINLWRPIIGPVLDNPLAVCDARSVASADLVATSIQHFGEGDLAVPRHRGEIYSVRYAPAHRWVYVSEMQPHELLLLKGYDSREDGRARFVPHTGFENPVRPAEVVPRESIEARTLVVYDEPV